MYLLSVTLTNFKTHRDRNFEFQPGTNAICGVNGAGKTSILEAIAWTLFNHRGSYKQEDLIRNGSGSAQVRVAFVSSYDSRTYEVERCTSRGYTLFDPQLGARLNLSRIKDEVEPWLQQHLGVPTGTDLSQLFANTIGVPQGTFTADFLLSPEKRKPIFDTILKVEEYRRVHKESNGLRRYAEAQVELLKSQLQQYEDRLQTWEALQLRFAKVTEELAVDQQRLASFQQQLEQIQADRAVLATRAQKIQTLQQQQQQQRLQLEAKRQAQQVLEQTWLRSQQATDLCQVHAADYRAYGEVESALKKLTQQNTQRQQLLNQRYQQQRNLDQQAAATARLQVQLEQREQLQSQLRLLNPLCEQQDSLEHKRQQLEQQQHELVQLQLSRQNLQERLEQLAGQQQEIDKELQTLATLQSSVDSIPDLERQQRRWQQRLSRVEAAQQFEAELQELVVSQRTQALEHDQQVSAALAALNDLQQRLPSLSKNVAQQLKTAIISGQTISQTMLTALDGILNDLAEQVDIALLKDNLKISQSQLITAYGHQAQLTKQESLRQTQAALVAQQQQIQSEMAAADQQLSQLDSLKQQLHQLEQSIDALGNPQGRYQLLKEQLQTMQGMEAEYERLHAQRQTLETVLADLAQQLAQFTDLEAEIANQQKLRQGYQTGYLAYIQNEKDAAKLEPLTTELTAANQMITELTHHQEGLIDELTQLSADFDPAALQRVEQQHAEITSKCDRITGSLPQQQRLQTELASQLDALETIANKREQTQIELKQKERVKRFINFARKAYKEAGPRITERYVQGISQEADRLFRELLNRPNVALEWTRDYEIIIQEGGNVRRFINLSGGEQMCAALAVRLALLKVLADIDIAFFDEPTTNMDRPRRESLAEAIARLKAFKQLFVISHDDTFEKVTENVILVERED